MCVDVENFMGVGGESATANGAESRKTYKASEATMGLTTGEAVREKDSSVSWLC